jgi:hypothetical protein
MHHVPGYSHLTASIKITELTQQVFTGLFDETQNGSVSLFSPVFRVMPFTSSLLTTNKSLDGRIDIQTDQIIPYPAFPPNTPAQCGHQIQHGFLLVDSQAIDIAPECAGRRQPRRIEKSVQHCVQSQIGKISDTVETYKQ